jgi:hypothetical protein
MSLQVVVPHKSVVSVVLEVHLQEHLLERVRWEVPEELEVLVQSHTRRVWLVTTPTQSLIRMQAEQ